MRWKLHVRFQGGEKSRDSTYPNQADGFWESSSTRPFGTSMSGAIRLSKDQKIGHKIEL